MTTTNHHKPYLPSDIDMTFPNDNNKELQNSENVLSIPSVFPSSNSANTDKQKTKATAMRTRNCGTLVGQSAYITQRKLKIKGGSIQSKNFYTEHPLLTALTPSIITPHSPRAGPSNDSSNDSTFIPTQHSSSSEESSEKSVISSDSSSNESFENVNLHSVQSTKKSQGSKIQHSNQGNRSQNIRGRGCRATINCAPQTQQTQYSDEGRNTKRQFPFISASRINVQPEDPKSPMSILKTFLTDDSIQNIVHSTNKYVLENPDIQTRTNNSQHSIFSLWKPKNLDEMWLYITLTLLMGIVNKPQYHMYWTTRHVFATPIFSRLICRDRYEQLQKMIHFSNPEEEENTDSLKKLRKLIDHLSNVYYENYNPEQNLAVGEYLSLWKSCLAFKICIPSKRERYGIKLYMVSESDTGYLLRFIVYTGGSTVYQEPVEELSNQFDDHTNPSKVVLPLLLISTLHQKSQKNCYP